ncbi:lectin MOA-related protein [Xenorhabdus khoisanae]|uniref:lectin MOA-related protein n=1 Tax=Xenorhabdus khoisanae TaxID=880157 RepID=UPI002358CB77|nr:lectin MOA-related protein [Xenorhabdus khoisanae]MDC9614307.1 lectin MOA-related protein [Xenorhabdus khoisanae]
MEQICFSTVKEKVALSISGDIYKESELIKYTFRNDSFTSEDFCYAYKSEASKHAYNKGLIHGYAIGIIYFTNYDNSICAVNVFIDALLNIYIFDPEFNSIKEAKYWQHIPLKIIM